MKPRYDTSPWTEEVNDASKHLWEMGISAADVAANISARHHRPITRNAVIGRAHRKKWVTPNTQEGDPGLRKPRGTKPPPREKRPNGVDGGLMVKLQAAHKLKFPKDDRRPTITEPIESRNMTLLELGPHDCRYPTSPDDATSHLFCGAEQVDGSSYCAHHDAVCCRPVRTWNPNPRGVTSQRSIGVGAGKDPSAVDDLPHGKTRAEHTGSSS